MNGLVYHLVSGHAFFSGVGLLILSALASLRPKGGARRTSSLMFLVGLILIALSSTPLSYWLYGIAAGTSCFWIVSRFRQRHQKPAAYSTAVMWAILGLIELLYHFSPTIMPVQDRSIAVIGDSVTAGVDGDETAETWPSLLARQHHIYVEDVSHIGETSASALKRVQSRGIRSNLVLVEIGGNDILGSTTSQQFETDLEALVKYLTSDGRQVVMFELPLPPFCHAYGRIQRHLASKYRVQLKPKARFLSVIAGSDSTLDSIHLSQSGHQLMADCVWGVIGNAIPARTTE